MSTVSKIANFFRNSYERWKTHEIIGFFHPIHRVFHSCLAKSREFSTGSIANYFRNLSTDFQIFCQINSLQKPRDFYNLRSRFCPFCFSFRTLHFAFLKPIPIFFVQRPVKRRFGNVFRKNIPTSVQVCYGAGDL